VLGSPFRSEIGSTGNLRSTTMRAFDEGEMKGIIGKMG